MFLAAVKKEIDEAEPGDVHYCPLQAVGTGTTDASLDSQQYRRQLLDAIRKQNPDKVLALIVESNEENAKTLRTLNDECKAVALRQKPRRDLICEEDCLRCSIKKIRKGILACIYNCFCKAACYCWSPCKQCCKDEQQPTEDHIEEEKQWIEILSNPLYISLEWLWRIYSKSSRKESSEGRCSTKPTTQSSTSVEIELSDEEENGKNQDQDAYALKPLDARVSTCPKDEGKANEDENQDTVRDSHQPTTVASTAAINKGSDEYETGGSQQNENSSHPSDKGNETEDENQDVIASALRDSHLLEMIAGNDLHQHKDEYEKRANEIEEFAVAVIEGSTRKQLIDIMDTKGDGCLKKEKSWNFSQSLSLLKIAADEKRKKVGEFLFVTAPCGNRAQSKL